ncbi:hypothetical protein [Spiroplasma endosymbiont of Nephrotoma flavescens]|uniref:hypothetical protein n=1 Tax=Spiroplasma endosymbiont of Nephrotoma flavescens TaxID=3066302 RepID=UPI00313E3519
MIEKNIQTQLKIMKNEKNIVAERIGKYNLVAKTIKILEDKIKKHLNGIEKEDIQFIKEQIDKLNTANEALELLQLELSDFAINFTHVDYWRIYSRLSQDIESRNVWIKQLQNKYVDSNNNLSDVQNAIRIKNQITVYNNYSNSLISIQDKIIAIKLQEVDADIDAMNQKISLQLADCEDTIRVLIDSQIVTADTQR